MPPEPSQLTRRVSTRAVSGGGFIERLVIKADAAMLAVNRGAPLGRRRRIERPGLGAAPLAPQQQQRRHQRGTEHDPDQAPGLDPAVFSVFLLLVLLLCGVVVLFVVNELVF